MKDLLLKGGGKSPGKPHWHGGQDEVRKACSPSDPGEIAGDIVATRLGIQRKRKLPVLVALMQILICESAMVFT